MHQRQYAVLRALVMLALVAGLLVLQAPTPQVAAQSQFQVVASNLDNPRGLAFGPDGALYVAEAGRGGSGPCVQGPEGETCYGPSGAITRVWQGTQERIATGLPSIAGENGANALGPVDIAVRSNGEIYFLIGLGLNPETRPELGPSGGNFGQLARLDGNGQWHNVVDVAGYEASANPDGEALDSNPYGLLALPDRWIVADAGGNHLAEVSGDGTISTLAVFPTRTVPSPPQIPNLPPELAMQSVPDTVTIGPDGAYYVGELTGFPFPQGAARVHRVVPGQEPTVYAEGFTNIIDLTFGPDGSLYVLQISAQGLLQAMGPDGDRSGALIRIAPGGTRTTVASEGLIAPAGVAIAADGGIYVSNFGVQAGAGQVVRVGQAPGGRPLPDTGVESRPVMFPETGYSLEGEFLDYWSTNGGLLVFGYPIASARQVNGQVAQWLERARFELHEANPAPYRVQLGLLGVEMLRAQGRDWQEFPKASPGSDHYFEETGHAIAPEFWEYWRTHGLEFGDAGVSFRESLALFGYPISPAQVEVNSSGDQVLTQWFQRARFEYHPDNPAAYQVLLGRLGAEALAQQER